MKEVRDLEIEGEYLKASENEKHEKEIDACANFHSKPARTLATIPLNMNDLDAYHWRHGITNFYPKAPIVNNCDNVIKTEFKMTDKEKIDLTFQSVTGRVATLIKSFADFKEMSLLSAFLQVIFI